MNKINQIKILTVALVALTAILIILKIWGGYVITNQDEIGRFYSIEYRFDLEKNNYSHNYFVKAFIPKENERQKIVKSNNNQMNEFSLTNNGNNLLGIWDGKFKLNEKRKKIVASYEVILNSSTYELDRSMHLNEVTESHTKNTLATDYIQSDNSRIKELSKKLIGESNNVFQIINSFYNHVRAIPSRPIKQLTTATEVLDYNEASCNGKSRLFVALCRSANIPARVKGGIILTNEIKKTSHLWAEVKINNTWIPFDAQNEHFAYIPNNYLELYNGDEFLVKRSSDMVFDYEYKIEEIKVNKGFLSDFNLFNIADKTGVSSTLLSLLMLLPLGALVVAIFRNVIGLKTFGVFLPVLIAISFLTTGVVFGLLSFVGVLLLISLMHFPLMNWGILHVPKLVVMLIGVVLTMILILYVGVKMNYAQIGYITFFPLVILTISAEKYARIVVEEGFQNASKILAQTLFVTLFCYAVISSNTIYLILMNFPEILLIIAVLSIHLGKWIGLRISEYKRFNWIIS